MGCNMGPLISSVAMYRPDIVVTAVMGTCMVFACFSAAALLAKRRHFLYLGGILGSFLSLLCTFRFVYFTCFARKHFTVTITPNRFLNFITGGSMSSGLYEIELYGGLFMFMAYIVFDTQVGNVNLLEMLPSR
jgi:Bax inhibitor 1